MNFNAMNAINVDGVRWGNAAIDAGGERRRAHQVQIAKGRTSLENLPWNDPLWLPVLVEEVGEIARALNDREPLGRLRSEAVQVAAMALAYADAIQEAMEFVTDPTPTAGGKVDTAPEGDAAKCHPRCTLGPDRDHPGYLEYRCIDDGVNALPFPGEANADTAPEGGEGR